MTGKVALYSAVDEDLTHFVRKYDVGTGTGRTQYWMGIIGLD